MRSTFISFLVLFIKLTCLLSKIKFDILFAGWCLRGHCCLQCVIGWHQLKLGARPQPWRQEQNKWNRCFTDFRSAPCRREMLFASNYLSTSICHSCNSLTTTRYAITLTASRLHLSHFYSLKICLLLFEEPRLKLSLGTIPNFANCALQVRGYLN